MLPSGKLWGETLRPLDRRKWSQFYGDWKGELYQSTELEQAQATVTPVMRKPQVGYAVVLQKLVTEDNERGGPLLVQLMPPLQTGWR